MVMRFRERLSNYFVLLAVENLQNLFFSRIKDPNLLKDENNTQGRLLRRTETFANSYPTVSSMRSKLT